MTSNRNLDKLKILNPLINKTAIKKSNSLNKSSVQKRNLIYAIKECLFRKPEIKKLANLVPTFSTILCNIDYESNLK